jgi:hypothetical protein
MKLYNCDVSRRFIIALVVCAILMVMVGAMVYEAFDIHDPKPFPVDPEFLMYTLGAVLMLCLGTAVLTVGLLRFYFSLSELLVSGFLKLARASSRRCETFEVERLLFSPPLSVISLRI